MSYQDALRVAVANHLNKYPIDDIVVHPNDIADLEVHWDDGDRYDPTYGGENCEPTLEVKVTLHPSSWRPHGATRTIDFSVVFTALLRAVLETGL